MMTNENQVSKVSKYYSQTFFIRVKVSLNLIAYRSNMDVDYVKKIMKSSGELQYVRE